MKGADFPWRPQDEEGANIQDTEFLDELSGDQIAFSKRAKRKIGDNADALARIIAQRSRLLGSKFGEIRCNGHNYIFELIRIELTWTENPMAPYDKFNFKREVSVSTKKEDCPRTFMVAKPSKRKPKK